ncbi:DUF2332 domain-containing protein [Paralimibaculum aggregatum]|nr:DUF2332 domain-containing protein [Limibaculum sp. NKW23]
MEAGTAERYRAFAGSELRGISPVYERLCLWVAASPALIGFLETLPRPKRQPNLFLAALRQVAGLPESAAALEAAVARRGDEIGALMLARRTQTNEPGRCAVLLPVLAALPGPLALIEVGASAGLCLLPERYGYRYGGHRLGAGPPVFPCDASPETPLPRALPEIAWRAGLDLAPVDPRDPEAAAWLEALVWPEETGRRDRLRAALDLARAAPPRVVAGDLTGDLAALAAEARAAAPAARLVVFHTAVLAYVEDQAARDAFAAHVAALGAVWIANESPRVYPEIAARAPPAPGPGWFLLSVDGRPRAWTRPHGQAIRWIG